MLCYLVEIVDREICWTSDQEADATGLNGAVRRNRRYTDCWGSRERRLQWRQYKQRWNATQPWRRKVVPCMAHGDYLAAG